MEHEQRAREFGARRAHEGATEVRLPEGAYPVIRELMALLHDRNLGAIRVFEELERMVSSVTPLTQIKKHIENLDFELALDRLKLIAGHDP